MKRRLHAESGLEIVTLERQGVTEAAITIRPGPDESPVDMFRRLADVLAGREGDVVRMDVFGLRAAYHASLGALGEVDWPITWLEGGPCADGSIAGAQVHTVSGPAVEGLVVDGRAVGRIFEDDDARYALFGDIRSADPVAPRADQARQTLENMEAALEAAGMTFANVLRTWFYNDAILDWYDAFNEVRTTFFTERHVFDRFMPASTGIGAANAIGTALVAEALAVDAKGQALDAYPVESPLQCSAADYGSSFSRAVEAAASDHRRLLVSGTASIEPGGRTAHVGDLDAQVDLTMRVVGAILESRDMSYADVTRAVAYFRTAADAPALDRYLAARDWPPLPVVVTESTICRDDLLFEIEVDAIV